MGCKHVERLDCLTFVKVCCSSQSNKQTTEISLPYTHVLNVDRTCLKYLADAILCFANVFSASGKQPRAIELMLDTGSAFSVLLIYLAEACCFLSLGNICGRNLIPGFAILHVKLRLAYTIDCDIHNCA